MQMSVMCKLFVQLLSIADENECLTQRICISGRCVNSYGGYYCVDTDSIISNSHLPSFY